MEHRPAGAVVQFGIGDHEEVEHVMAAALRCVGTLGDLHRGLILGSTLLGQNISGQVSAALA